MPPKRRVIKPTTSAGPQVEDYRHDEKRTNNPSAGLTTDYSAGAASSRTRYEYDPHRDPQLVWAGKAEHTSFEVENVPLYVHERISTQAIVRSIQREETQKSLFGDPELPLQRAIQFYQHDMDWANRLVLGDSLLVMNSLLERELMAGQVQTIYIDPPYGIGYNSNFQSRTDKRDVRDGADEDLTREPEQIKAYRDTWTLGIHSYLSYLRDRLLIAKDLLRESGSVFVQISEENLHHVRELMDEVFGADNFVSVISYVTTAGFPSGTLSRAGDYVVWYARDKGSIKYHSLFWPKEAGDRGAEEYKWIRFPDGSSRALTADEASGDTPLPEGARAWRYGPLTSSGYTPEGSKPYVFEGKSYSPGPNNHWKVTHEGLDRLAASGLLIARTNSLAHYLFADNYPVLPINNVWNDTKWGFDAGDKAYVVQTNVKVIARCLLMTTDPGDLVLDPTCGSGTTAFVAEQWGRRWITCDTSRVAIFLARQRLLTAKFDYYALADEASSVDGGFRYRMVPHITLKSIANNRELDPKKVEERRKAICKANPKAKPEGIERLLREANEAFIQANADQETLYDQPEVQRGVVRVSGPFTVEAIPPPSLEAMEDTPIGGEPEPLPATSDADADSSTETGHIDALVEQLRKDGVLFPGNKRMKFASVTGCGSGVIHAEGEPTNGGSQGLKRVAISFGPLYGSVTAQQVADGIREANLGGFDGVVFCGFSFDAEAQGTITSVTHRHLKVFMAHIRPDMLMTDEEGNSLLKTTATSQLFTVFGEPEVKVHKGKDGLTVELVGVDVYDPLEGTVTSTGADKVAAWFLDTDYDGRTFCVCQAFFPDGSAWDKLGKALRSAIDPDKFDLLSGTTSLPFHKGDCGKVAVKVIDRRGNEVMVVKSL